MGNYSIHIYNTSGVKKAVLTDFYSLTYSKKVNEPGALWFTISGEHAILSELQEGWLIDVRRQKKDGTWETDFFGIHKNETWRYTDTSKFSSYTIDLKAILGWRIVNWYAGTTNRSTFSNRFAETVMKEIVSYNLGPNATTANGRLRTGTISGVTVSASASGGNRVYWNCHGENVLGTLIDLSEIAGGDFDFTITSPTAYVFEFYDGQLGSDLSNSVLFSLENGNMANPTLQITRSSEKTVGCVWGQGNGSSRDYTTVTGTNYSSTRDYELFVNGKMVELGDTDSLNDLGESKLSETEARSVFDFDIIQADGSEYKVDYDLGDLVSAKNPFSGVTSTFKIKSVTVKLHDNGREEIKVQLESQ